MAKITVIIMLLLKVSKCFAQSGGNFLIYNAHKNRCLGDSLLQLTLCNPQNPKQQFRWTSENRIFNIVQKKCLGTGVKSEGNKLQWFICDSSSDLQKWECHNNTLFGLKNESLYLSLQGDTTLLTLSKDPGEKGKWTIHGTTDSVCSRPYEEIYTIKGNAFGQPCEFPFLYKNKWYTDCTTDGSSSRRLWCPVKQEFEPDQLWGYCPIRKKDDDFWVKNPLTDVYYQLNEESALNWYQARKSCQQQGGDLLSVTEPHEQTFISGLTQKTGAVLWTGLNSLDASSGWHWVNGQPLRYLKWLSGQPSSLPGHSCGVLSQLHGSEWSTALCSDRHGYICQRGLSTPTVPPAVHTGSCTTPWIPYSGHCYLLYRTKKTWLEAKDTCRREGGDLLSVLSVEEQSFVISQLGYLKTDEVWIGLNDLKTAMLFDWSDHSSVPFVLWDVNEPSHDATLKEDCVSMRGEEGKWADQVCQNKYEYICKKKTLLSPSTNDTVVTSPGCKLGWVRYGYYCYQTGAQTKTFQEAKQMCEKSGSYLVDITDRIENAFLVSLIGARSEKHFWIGLSNQKNKHIFEWTNTSKISFTHFNAGMPGGKQGCVAMTTGVLAGLWDVLSCSNAEKYICKQKAEGVTPTPAHPTTPPANCSEGWFPLKNRDQCFKLFVVSPLQEKTWFEALAFCRELGGDLLSIHSSIDIESNPDQYSMDAWIGYSIQDPTVGYTWSDGSASSYENWADGEPNNFNNIEKCASTHSSWWRYSRREWNDLQCDHRADWFCEIQKGVTPKEVQITDQTYNKTDDGWIIFKESQYYFKRGSDSMEEGRRFCKYRHGELVVINDEEERLFVWHQSKLSYSDVFIGMKIDLDKSLMWMDGSPVVFQAWEKNEPAFGNEDENCVRMSRSQGLWKSVNCGDDNKIVCKRNGTVPVNSTAAPTEPPQGGCHEGWVRFQKKCYRIQTDKQTWFKARSYCKDFGGNLASITNKLQQAFLTLKIIEDTQDFWIGFSNLASGRYKWTDGSPVGFRNFKESRYYSMRDKKCVAVGNQERSQPGQWVEKDCNDTSGFICSQPLNSDLSIPTPTELPKTLITIGNASYLIVQTNLTWGEAKQHCESQEAKLASIRDLYAQYYIELQANKLGQPLWIGLNSQETHGYFLWIDNWLLNMERWSYSEPKKDQPCVYVDVDGGWKTAQCNKTFYSLCKKSTEIAPTPPAQYPGVCPELTEERPKMTWQPFKGHCYSFVLDSYSWRSASRICSQRGASLASIQDMEESSFIEKYISFLGNNEEKFWIGLYKTFGGHWLWMDNNVVDYINWDEPGDSRDDYYHDAYENVCAFISAKTKKWSKSSCRYRNANFICKTAKVINPAPTVNSTVAYEVHRSYVAGVSVVVVIVVLSVLAGLAYVYRRNSNRPVVLPSLVNPLYYATRFPRSEEKDTKTLVENNE
ncbi:macrophage mannose receptor 1-like [Hoplias malabaricus]|uniref:macrophage mannose receptor 1-like n=1 Tax=Hoplias malabaricus TaxID=27720 RepID=UPI003462DD65